MEGFKGTPGPWIMRCRSIGSVGTERKLVHICMEPIDPYHGMDEEDEANVNLIAAAPELLEALQRIMSIFHCPTIDSTSEEYREWYEATDIANAALAKALDQ